MFLFLFRCVVSLSIEIPQFTQPIVNFTQIQPPTGRGWQWLCGRRTTILRQRLPCPTASPLPFVTSTISTTSTSTSISISTATSTTTIAPTVRRMTRGLHPRRGGTVRRSTTVPVGRAVVGVKPGGRMPTMPPIVALEKRKRDQENRNRSENGVPRKNSATNTYRRHPKRVAPSTSPSTPPPASNDLFAFTPLRSSRGVTGRASRGASKKGGGRSQRG